MFGIGGFELFIILVFAFLIFGPDKLPEVAKTVGKAIARFRSAQEEMNSVIKSTDIFDPNDPEQPFKDPVEALDKLAKHQEEKQSAKKTGSSSSAKASSASNAKPASTSDAASGDDAAPAKQESFTERKARYERERAARKAAEAKAAEEAEKAEKTDAAETVAEGSASTAEPSPTQSDASAKTAGGDE